MARPAPCSSSSTPVELKGCREGTAVERIWRMRRSRPDFGPGFQAKVLEKCQVVTSSLESGQARLEMIARRGNLIAGSIQFEYDPGELAKRITTKLVIKMIVKPMCSNFRWPDRIQFEYYSG